MCFFISKTLGGKIAPALGLERKKHHEPETCDKPSAKLQILAMQGANMLFRHLMLNTNCPGSQQSEKREKRQLFQKAVVAKQKLSLNTPDA